MNGLAEVLAAHHLQGDTSRILDDAGQCTCGTKFYEVGGSPAAYLDAHRRLMAAHADHLAAAVTAFLLERLDAEIGEAFDPILAEYVGPPVPHEAIAIVLDMAQVAALAAVKSALGGA